MGFDSFGLPAENYAIKHGVHPGKSTADNIDYMKSQFTKMGAAYDWSHGFNTSDPEYYKWTQWIFIELFRNGLAYKKEAPVNWCENCATVLANEQVKNGSCERCKTRVKEKNLEQWFFKITAFADKLLDNLEDLDWPEKTKLMQRNWIGRSNNSDKVKYRLHDWLVSRQRYWGAPIPIIYCEKCGTVPVPESDLPVVLPENVTFRKSGKSPLAGNESFLNCNCPECGGPATRETDTLDTFVCSSWYYLRFPDPYYQKGPFNEEKITTFFPVDRYCGGPEHACMHLLYTRFITMALFKLGHLPFEEPFPHLTHQGMILGENGEKMSKSGNSVSPDAYVDKFGSDILRLCLHFGFNFTEGGKWHDGSIKAVRKFCDRITAFYTKLEEYETSCRTKLSTETQKSLARRFHYTVKQMSINTECFMFNTAVARLMELLSAMQHALVSADFKEERDDKQSDLLRDTADKFIVLLSPFAPHLAEELWNCRRNQSSVFNTTWPRWDESVLEEHQINMAVMVNGKKRSEITLQADASDQDIITAGLAGKTVQARIADRTVIRNIIVPGKLINFIT
jgi:leucyl-tRNA synthetase